MTPARGKLLFWGVVCAGWLYLAISPPVVPEKIWSYCQAFLPQFRSLMTACAAAAVAGILDYYWRLWDHENRALRVFYKAVPSYIVFVFLFLTLRRLSGADTYELSMAGLSGIGIDLSSGEDIVLPWLRYGVGLLIVSTLVVSWLATRRSRPVKGELICPSSPGEVCPEEAARPGFLPRCLAPALWFCVLALWWSLPFFFIALVAEGEVLGRHFTSFLPYFLCYGTVLATAVLLALLEWPWRIWERHGYWVRFLYLLIFFGAAWTAQIYAAMSMEAVNINLEYFGGDPEGSFMMLAFPITVMYAVFGSLFGIIHSGWAWRKRIRSKPSEAL
jgi:hypothetical protein